MTKGPIRIGHLSNFSPRKLGTGEGRLIACASAARERGHSFTLFGRTPIHPEVDASLQAAGATWAPLGELERKPLRSASRLARDFDVLHLNMVPPRGRVALAAYAAWPAKVLFVDRVSGPPGDPVVKRPLPHRLLDQITMLRVHQLVGITEYVRVRASMRFGVPRERTCTIYNGVDTALFFPGPAPSQDSPLRILCVASLIPEKGIDVLLRAVAVLDPGSWRLAVVGDGPSDEKLKTLAHALGIQGDVRFLGLRNDVPNLMRESDVFVHPAVWQEALGNTVLEGMASGCSVIASRVGGIPELIRNGKEGLLVEAGDFREIAKQISVLAHSPELRGQLGKAARVRVTEDFSLEKSVSRYIDSCEMAAAGELLV